MHCYRSRIIDSHAATPAAEADQKIQCTLGMILAVVSRTTAISGIYGRGAYFSSTSLKQGVQGSPPEAIGLKEHKNDNNHKNCITHSHIIATIDIN